MTFFRKPLLALIALAAAAWARGPGACSRK